MRRVVLVILIVLFMQLSSGPQISAALRISDSEGQKCRKVGLSSSDNWGSDLVCRRVSGKRIWQYDETNQSAIPATNLKVKRTWLASSTASKFLFTWDSLENWDTQYGTLIYWNAAFPTYQYRYPVTNAKTVTFDFLSIQPICFTILSEVKVSLAATLANAACEDATTVFTTTTTTTTTTVAPRKPPSGNYWEKQHLNSSDILMYGNPYRLYFCTNGSANSVLTLWVNVLNTWVKRTDSYGTASDSSCSGDYPTTQSFYWFIDWSGTPISNTRATLNFKVTGLSQDYFYSRTIWPSQAAANQEASEVARKIACAFGKITGCK